MKKFIFYGLLVILLVFGFISCDGDDNGINYESKFVGVWSADDSSHVRKFTESTWSLQRTDGFEVKGTWSLKNQSIFVETANQLKRGDLNPEAEFIETEPLVTERLFEFISNSKLKFTTNAFEAFYTKIE